MNARSLAKFFWGEKSHLAYVMGCAFLMLFAWLGTKDIWTQEHRWADIVVGMFYRRDFLHPFLGNVYYYDKPLLSYWLIAGLAWLSGSLTALIIRIPSAVSGLLSLYMLYLLGTRLRGRNLGMLSAWMLLSCYFFVFWARISSADMLNVCGSLGAVTWYIYNANRQSFLAYSGFFIILALTSLCKGLIGAIVPLIVVLLHMLLNNTLLKHCNVKLLVGLLPALIIYLTPFFLSSTIGNQLGLDNGLYLVYKENILRYFQPFDHRGSLFTYFIYLPLYCLPWTFLFIPALIRGGFHYRSLDITSRWLFLVVIALFLFFSISGSRRSYYILPLVPFALLFTADWIMENRLIQLQVWAGRLVLFGLIMSFLLVDILPAWYYAHFGVSRFADLLKAEAEKIQPLDKWHIVLLDAETKLIFYLHLPPTVTNWDVEGDRESQSYDSLTQAWPFLNKKSVNTIFITRSFYKDKLDPLFKGYTVVELPKSKYTINAQDGRSIAYLPQLQSSS